MKYSLAITGLILAVFAAFGWRGQDALEQLREERQGLLAEAAALGLAADGEAAAGRIRHRSAARPHADRDADVVDLVGELIGLLKDLKAGVADKPEGSVMARITAIVERLYQLDGGQVGMLVEELRKTGDIDDEARRNVIGFAIVSLADSRPEAAVAVFAGAQDLFPADKIQARRDVMAKVLGTWAASDPLAALEWMRATGAQDAELVTDDTKRALIAGAARKNPALALQWIAELDVKDRAKSIAGIVGTARTAADQKAMLAMLRGLADGPARVEDFNAGLQRLGAGIAGQGFAASAAWLAAAEPTQEESLALAQGLDYNQTKADSGRWLEWMGEQLPADKLAGRVGPLMAEWTTQDYRAAGQWLSAAPEGPAKQAAVVGYAKTVARYEPAAAAQWAETLPSGSARQTLLRQVRDEWTRLDPGAAAAFASRHGLDP